MRSSIFGAMIAVAAFAPTAAYATGDHVETIQVCSGNIYLIQMQTAGWVYVNVTDVGQDQADRIMEGAITLLATGHQTSYFDAAGTTSLECGVTAAEITVLGITASP
jgi:hypothetical protein